jgi:hypothetical protein
MDVPLCKTLCHKLNLKAKDLILFTNVVDFVRNLGLRQAPIVFSSRNLICIS